MTDFELKKLPLSKDIETKIVLKKLNEAHRALAELKGLVSSIPNESILINTLGLQEAKDSSAIENIITTQDEIYKALISKTKQGAEVKEVIKEVLVEKEVIVEKIITKEIKDQHLIEELEKISNAKVVLVDGEIFSWYGTRLTRFKKYFES